MCLKKTKINEKEAGVGPFKKHQQSAWPEEGKNGSQISPKFKQNVEFTLKETIFKWAKCR